MNIKTNNQPRPLLSFCELTRVQQDEVINERGALECDDWKGFVFKGNVYSLDEFTILSDGSEEKAAGWDGAMGTSYFHAILVKLDMKDLDSVIVGQMFC